MVQRIRITLRAELASALHILGPGRAAALLDRSIELDLKGYPVIPASSIRGRLRVHLERLLKAWGLPVCVPPSPEQMCPHHWPAGKARRVRFPPKFAAPRNDTRTEKGPEGGYCMACRIFGSTWHPAGIANSDMRLLRLIKQQLDPSLLRAERTSVAISRRLGIAQTGALLFTETTVRAIDEQPLCFEGVMQGRLSDEEAGWLLAGARLVNHAGGSKERGLGEMEVRIAKVERWQQEEQSWQMLDANELIEEALNDGTT